MAGGPCLGQGRFVVILAPEAGLGETAEHCFCCRTEALPCAWISSGQGTNACRAMRQQRGTSLPVPDMAGRKSPKKNTALAEA